MVEFSDGQVLRAADLNAVANQASTALTRVTAVQAAVSAISTTPQFSNLQNYATDAAAAAALAPGSVYLVTGSPLLRVVPPATSTDPPVTPPAGDALLPTGWVQVFADDFTRPATWGVNALDPNKWGQRSYGSGPAHGGGNVFWEDGSQTLESTGSTIRIHVKRISNVWRMPGFQQGSTDIPGQEGYHPGYGEFHCRFRHRYSHAHAPGVGIYALMWDANNGWGIELDWLEMPGSEKTTASATMHWDPSGNYDLGADNQKNNNYSISDKTLDLTLWHVWDCRRTYRTVNGVRVATIRVWIDGVEIAQKNGWVDNQWLVGNMVFGAAGFAATPAYFDWYTAPDGSTPADSWGELDYVYIWTPGSGSGGTGGSGGTPGGGGTPTTKTIAPLSPEEPGTRAAGAWTTTVTTTGLSRIAWVVVNGGGDWSWEGDATIVPTSGSVTISPVFTRTDQFVKVFDPDNVDLERESGWVTII